MPSSERRVSPGVSLEDTEKTKAFKNGDVTSRFKRRRAPDMHEKAPGREIWGFFVSAVPIKSGTQAWIPPRITPKGGLLRVPCSFSPQPISVIFHSNTDSPRMNPVADRFKSAWRVGMTTFH